MAFKTSSIIHSLTIIYRKLDMDLMPGFRVTWWYTGDPVEPEVRFITERETQQFVRKGPLHL